MSANAEHSELYLVLSRTPFDLDLHGMGNNLEEALEAAQGLSEHIRDRTFFVAEGKVLGQYFAGGKQVEEAVLG